MAQRGPRIEAARESEDPHAFKHYLLLSYSRRLFGPLIVYDEADDRVTMMPVILNRTWKEAATSAIMSVHGSVDGADEFIDATWDRVRSLGPFSQAMIKWWRPHAEDFFDNLLHDGLSEQVSLDIKKAERGGIVYWNFGAPELKSHSLETVHKTVAQSIDLCQDMWKWHCRRPRVLAFTGGNAMGLAFNPGAGNHKIGLNRRLLQDYDTMSIFRTLIHEWCHHAREEKAPRGRAAFDADSHDEMFCEMLKQVDPVVRDSAKDCVFFTDQVDPNMAAVKAREAARTKVTYTPDAGRVVIRLLKNGIIKMDWVSKGGTWRKVVQNLNGYTLRELADHFTDAQLYEVEVVPHDARAARMTLFKNAEQQSLASLLPWAAIHYKGEFAKLMDERKSYLALSPRRR
jgi:predicted SprT family Zn-dependent metalloprotease